MMLFSAGQVFCADVDVVTTFGGFQYESRNASDVRFYIPAIDGMDLIFGIGFLIPNNKNGSIGTNGLIGVNMAIPILDEVDLLFSFNKPGGTSGAQVDEDFKFTKFSIMKQWLFSVTDQVRLGVMARVLEFDIDGSERVYVMAGFEPVIAVMIDIF